MRIYNYDPKTGEYLGDGLADESPLEPGQFLIPANATSKPVPKTKPGEAAIFADDNWRVVADYRGRSVCALDADGYYAGPATLALGESPDARRILADPPPADLPRPKRSGSAWVDGRTNEEKRVHAQATLKEAAQVALDKSDTTLLRCYEAGVAVPAEWATYRGQLRGIVSGKSAATELPVRPEYPA